MYGITGMGDPIDFIIMQSETDANTVIRNFEDFISQGHAPEEAERLAYIMANTKPENLTYYDYNRVTRRVEEVIQASSNFDRRG